MIRIKICGLSRPCDIDMVNKAQPDFCGFVVDVPRSRRSVSADQLRVLRQRLSPSVTPVGVFVNAPLVQVAALLNDGTVSLAQLHGQEDAHYIAALRRLTTAPLIQAFRMTDAQDVRRANESAADLILLDNGAGGTGQRFDWTLTHRIDRPFILAGGLTPENLATARAHCKPYAFDLSSGVETAGYKDANKISAAVAAVRSIT